MAADLIFDEASAELRIITDSQNLNPATLVVVDHFGAFEIHVGTAALQFIFLGRVREEIADILTQVKSVVWIKIDDISVVDAFEVSALIVDASLVHAYVLTELGAAWSEYCETKQLGNDTGNSGMQILEWHLSQVAKMPDASLFPDYRNINLFTVTESDGLLNEVARQPAGGLAGLRIRQEMESFLKTLSLRQ